MPPRLTSVDDVLALPVPAPDFRIAYGNEPLQFGELRLPRSGAPHPVAIVLHGGCWRSRYDVAHIGSFSQALTLAGVATWAVEYRRVGNAGGGWPGTFRDVARAADRLRDLASEHALDLRRVVAVGHSAGGQLALWLASRWKLPAGSEIRGGPEPLPLMGVVSLAGVDDLRRAVKEGVCDQMAAALLDGGPDERPERYREASPVELLPIGVPLRLLNGALDPVVPVAFGRDFEKRSRALGDDVKLTVLEDAGHFDLIAPASGAFRVVEEEILALLRTGI
jgi:acetyl esterase/lipase